MVDRLTSPNTDGFYIPGDVLVIQVEFSEEVHVTGVPTLTLETGATDSVALYTSGTGTETLAFTYTVAAGDESPDLDAVATNPLSLGHSATITDLAGENFLFGVSVTMTWQDGGTQTLQLDTQVTQ